MTDLLPCPWGCNSHLKLLGSGQLVVKKRQRMSYYVSCTCCAAHGPVAIGPDEAIREWNRRTTQSNSP